MTADVDLYVEVRGGEIIVTLPGTNFMVKYFKPAGNVVNAKHLPRPWSAADRSLAQRE